MMSRLEYYSNIEKRKKISSNLYLHIGIPRTGSTFLQHEIFPNINGVNFIVNDSETKHILTNIEKYNYDAVNNKILRLVEQNKINLISEENIYCGNMWEKEDKRVAKLEQLKQFFPHAKIILGVRDTQELLVSWYKKYVASGGILKFRNFLRQAINPGHLKYDRYLEHLYSIFRKENVYVYNFEDLKTNVNSFVKDLCDFMGAPVPSFENRKKNIGYSLWQLKFSLLFNQIFQTPLNPAGLIPLDYRKHPHRKVFQSPYFPCILRGQKVSIKDLIN